MKKAFFFLLLGGLSYLTGRADRYTDMAQRQLDWLKAGTADSILAHATPEMRAQLPAATVAALWGQLTMQAGAWQRQMPWTQTGMQGYHVCQSVQVFANAALALNVVLDDDLRLAGLNFVPAQKPAEPAEAETTSPQADTASPNAATAQEAAYEEREVTVRHGEISLPATLTLPKEREGRVPAAVLVHGSGPNDRDETIGPNKPFRELAHALAERGIATLRYDKRTKVYGARTAEVSGGRLDYDSETVDDAVEALRLLAASDEVAPRRVFVIGHSLGGTLAPRIAERADVRVAGIVGLAAAARPFWEMVDDQLRYISSLQGLTAEQAQAAAQQQAAAMRAQLPAEYLAAQAAYDPLGTAQGLGALPMLYVQGGHDYQVTEADLNLWKGALKENPQAAFRLFPTLDHLLRPLSRMAVPADYMNAGTMSADAVAAIADFIAGVKP